MEITLFAKIAIVGASIIIGLASTMIFKMQKDNPVEQIAEEVIEKETGVNFDLTPDTTDKKE